MTQKSVKRISVNPNSKMALRRAMRRINQLARSNNKLLKRVKALENPE